MIDFLELMRFLIDAAAARLARGDSLLSACAVFRRARPRPHRNAIQTVVPEPLT